MNFQVYIDFSAYLKRSMFQIEKNSSQVGPVTYSHIFDNECLIDYFQDFDDLMLLCNYICFPIQNLLMGEQCGVEQR